MQLGKSVFVEQRSLGLVPLLGVRDHDALLKRFDVGVRDDHHIPTLVPCQHPHLTHFAPVQPPFLRVRGVDLHQVLIRISRVYQDLGAEGVLDLP